MKSLPSNATQFYQIRSRKDLLKDLDIHLAVKQQVDLRLSLSFSIVKINKYQLMLNSFGKEIADYVLNTLAERLSETLKTDATIYRLKTEEFAIVFKHQSKDKINQLVKYLIQPIAYGHNIIDIQLSLGIVDITTQIEKTSEILRRADIALKLAKSEAVNWQYFNHQLDPLSHTDRDMFIELEKAIDNNLLTLAGQPIFNLETGQVIMVEILLRWQHNEYGAVNPTKIIELASKHECLSKVALYVAKQLVIFLNKNSKAYQNISFALNFNMPQIINIPLIQALVSHFDKLGIDKSRFIFEATEIDSCPIALDSVADHFRWIKQQGIKIAIDDFGSGYSTLNYVNNLEVDIIKIDRSLVCDIELNTRKLETLITLVKLCHKLGVVIVVEGIENLAQHNLIKNIPFRNILVQGYFYAMPTLLTEKSFCESSYFKKLAS